MLVKFLIENWTLILIAVVSAVMLMWPRLRGGASSGGLSPNQAVQLINRNRAVVVDVRGADAFAAGHLVGAKHVPLAEIADRLATAVKNKGVPLIMVGEGSDSVKAVAQAKKLGYEQAQFLAGGLKNWRDANLPVVT